MMKIYLMGLLLLAISPVFGQLNPMGGVYYQNQFLANPAMAGLENELKLNGAFKAQWVGIEGSPKTQYLTADYGLSNNKVGLGFLVYNEGAGVINRTRATVTYAYHLPLNNETSYLDFGISAGIMNEWIDFGKAKGDLTDDVLNSFNDRKLYLDGDFGLAYRDEKLTIQGSLPNLKRFFKRDQIRNVVDRSIYFIAAGYKFTSTDLFSTVEPKLVYRGVQNYDGIFDAGVNLQFLEDKLMLSGIYHSTNSVTLGFGANYKQQFSILFQYTTNTSQMQNYSNGDFEVGLRYNLKTF
ncbi:PorP/SprF family type IX secretion system membrane protein [Pedobacter sandarakinus]|uniref:PorP/SprF family type IX secretion system membrane protein n=1 Tax=Pedobacter sandarakinus TaxID=353156 RepID=UPI002245AEC7|nr:type IX secretion system membrane protein PorP/SprF [Pedobacter sandarakinus]MCX2576160.1 type IX secretion system membrane protein PorP/SprF [Pedobacter sandarakinus]